MIKVLKNDIRSLTKELSEVKEELSSSIKPNDIKVYFETYGSNAVYIKNEFKEPLALFVNGSGPFPQGELNED
jgi:hypothetical protein